jgi:hypothetical protein
MVENLIDLHEEGQGRDVLPDLLVDPPASGEAGEVHVPEMLEELQPAEDTARTDALRIRELEIVAALAADSLQACGDEATAEIVRRVLNE